MQIQSFAKLLFAQKEPPDKQNSYYMGTFMQSVSIITILKTIFVFV